MDVANLAPSTANSLIDGYCDDFIALAAVLAQTLEQASLRGIDITDNVEKLRRISAGMNGLSAAIEAVIAPDAQSQDKQPQAKSAPKARRQRASSRNRPQPSLKGCNRSMPIRSVFQFLERMRKSGVIKVKLPDETMQFAFDQGRLTSCATSHQGKGDQLADHLKQLCDPAEVEEALLSSDSMDDKQVGEQVLRAGAATKAQIRQAQTTQLQTRFARACDATNARYAFLEASLDPSPGPSNSQTPAGAQ